MEEKHPPKLFTWRTGLLMLIAGAGGIGLNAYRTYRAQGKLDTAWFVSGAITLATVGTIFFFFARHANKPEKED